MNREIKFRAWDGYKMYYPNDESNYGVRIGGEIYELYQDGPDHIRYHPLPDGSSLMQYTGIKDKNGKEIYEGDIIKAPHDFGPGGFHERTFVFRTIALIGAVEAYWDMSAAEIIGNIYENPELLNSTEATA